ncbi:MAG TPA: hypothetical protein VGB50_09375 [Flavobacterium sp.]|jgi:hypothetical protein
MKNALLLLLLVCVGATAQTVSVPDPNFLAALIEDGVDTNANGSIEVLEAISVYDLDVHNENITDITGIQAFINVAMLDVSE